MVEKKPCEDAGARHTNTVTKSLGIEGSRAWYEILFTVKEKSPSLHLLPQSTSDLFELGSGGDIHFMPNNVTLTLNFWKFERLQLRMGPRARKRSFGLSKLKHKIACYLEHVLGPTVLSLKVAVWILWEVPVGGST